MSVFFHYLFQRFFYTFLTLCVLILGLIWLAQSLRYLDLIINSHLEVRSFLTLVLYLIPDLFVFVSPIAFAITLIFVYHRLIIHHELAAFQAIGVSPFSLSLPAISLGGILFVMLVSFNIWLVPNAFQKFREQKQILQTAISGVLLKEGHFNSYKNLTVYVQETTPFNELKNILIYQQDQPNFLNYTTFAKSGQLFAQKGHLFVILKDGQRQEFNTQTKTMQIVSFEELSYDLSKHFKTANQAVEKPAEKKLMELLFPNTQILSEMRKKFQIEAHQRLLIPFLCLLYPLISAFMLSFGIFNRRRNQKKIVLTAGIFFITQIGLSFSIHMAPDIPFGFPFLYGLVLSLIIYLVFVLKPSTVRLSK